jgi:hypothetical protein
MVFTFMKLIRVSIVYIVPLVKFFFGVPLLHTVLYVETVDCHLDRNAIAVHKRRDVTQGGVCSLIHNSCSIIVDGQASVMSAPRNCYTRLIGSMSLEEDDGPGFTAIVAFTQSTLNGIRQTTMFILKHNTVIYIYIYIYISASYSDWSRALA